MKDILLEFHPVMLAKKIRLSICESGRSHAQIARALGITAGQLRDILECRRLLCPSVAARLSGVLGLDGRLMYLAQEERRFEIARRALSDERREAA